VTEEWRLIKSGFNDAYTNMAIDEAILISGIDNKVPNTIRFYRWRPSAVSLGFSQQVEREVELEACEQLGVDVVRRPTGGGSVYHDSNGELTYSIVTSSDKIPSDLISLYRFLCHGIVLACRKLGLSAELSFDEKGRQCPNIVVKGRKISGSAQTQRKCALLQHGTILLDSDLETMRRVLKMGRPTASMPLDTLEARVTTLRRALARSVSFGEVEGVLRLGFEAAFQMKLTEKPLSQHEMELSSKLRQTAYSTQAWNLRRETESTSPSQR